MQKPGTVFGFDIFDLFFIVLSAFLISPYFSDFAPIPEQPHTSIIFALFLIGLYLKRYDKDYVKGVAYYNKQHSFLTSFVIDIGGALLGGILGMLFIFLPLMNLAMAHLDLPQAAFLDTPFGIFTLLSSIIIFMGLIPYNNYKALKKPKKFYRKTKHASIIRLISRLFILIQSVTLLAFVYNTIGRDLANSNELFISFAAIFIFTSIMYLPIKIHETFLHPKNGLLRSLLQTTLALTIYHTALSSFGFFV